MWTIVDGWYLIAPQAFYAFAALWAALFALVGYLVGNRGK